VTISSTRAAAPIMSMSTTRMTPVVTVMVGGSTSLQLATGTTLASIQIKLDATLRQTGPPSGGGPGSPGSPGGSG
jgi:hypothetical protein